MTINFESAFHMLTGNPSFPWQRALFDRFILDEPANRFPAACDIPTGLGKTSVIAIWLLALAHRSSLGAGRDFPRRLVYVVNRRTVVDQSTREAERLRERLTTAIELSDVARALSTLCSREVPGSPLAISTLRGEFADNAEWRSDPARPAVVVGTVDMIGSRLLFSGYGRGFKSRPLHAALLGHDALLVHDEAHLEPAFQELVEGIQREQSRCSWERHGFSVIALSATARTGSRAGSADAAFSLSATDFENDIVRSRFEARKQLRLQPLLEGRKLPEALAELAKTPEFEGQAVLVFVRRVRDVDAVRTALKAPPNSTAILTGTLRGYERDRLARSNAAFARFMPPRDRAPDCTPQTGTVFLISTSAGEVGVNLTADHLVCDLTPFDSMVQRLGRVNRFGSGTAKIEVVFDEEAFKSDDEFAVPLQRTHSLLTKLTQVAGSDRLNASPAALSELPREERLAAFSPQPNIPRTTDILFDAWAMTTVRDLAGRPPVTDYLHGEEAWEPPETYVAWRREVEYVTGPLLLVHPPDELLEDYPLKAHELLHDRTERVVEQLTKLAERHPQELAWIVNEDGSIDARKSLTEIVDGDKKAAVERLARRTVILPPRVGGLNEGVLDGAAPFEEDGLYDVADEWADESGKRRERRQDHSPPPGMRLVRSIVPLVDPEEFDSEDQVGASQTAASWYWFVKPRFADDDGSRTARASETLSAHLQKADGYAAAIAERLLDPNEAAAVRMAAKWHDLGKSRALWQRSIGNPGPEILAKSGPEMSPRDITRYRHEFGSLTDLRREPEFGSLTLAQQELILHLVAAHHGRARPHFDQQEAFDPDHPDAVTMELARSIPERFAELQVLYGRWGLAYLESLVRAADALASQDIKAADPNEEEAQ